jgi:hypothetical protein
MSIGANQLRRKKLLDPGYVKTDILVPNKPHFFEQAAVSVYLNTFPKCTGSASEYVL